jgi:cytochrome P450
MLQIAPGPKGHFLLGSLPEFNRDLLGLLKRTQEEYGDIVRLRLAHTVGHVLCHPAMAEHAFIVDTKNIVKYSQVKPQRGLALFMGKGLVMNYGDSWRRQRDLINPMFRPKIIEGLAEATISCAEQLVARLDRHAANDTGVDVWREAVQSALQAVLATLFSAPATENSDEMRKAATVVLRYCAESTKNPLMPPLNWPTARNRRFHAAMATINNHVNSLIRDRKTSDTKHADFLELLLDATYEHTGERMTESQVRDEVVTMLGAGHETSASALTWALIQIARRPDIARRIREELAQVVGDNRLGFSHLRQLRYVQAVVQETLRLYPPIPVIPRAAINDTTIEGYHIPRGSMLFISVYNIHRHKDFWRDPHEFDPDRFFNEGKAKQKHRCAFIPFGAGERFCIGSNFASVELAIFLAEVIGAFDLQLVVRDVPPEIAITMRPSGPVYMQLTKVQSTKASPAAAT